jgi:hypothetical protein
MKKTLLTACTLLSTCLLLLPLQASPYIWDNENNNGIWTDPVIWGMNNNSGYNVAPTAGDVAIFRSTAGNKTAAGTSDFQTDSSATNSERYLCGTMSTHLFSLISVQSKASHLTAIQNDTSCIRSETQICCMNHNPSTPGARRRQDNRPKTVAHALFDRR